MQSVDIMQGLSHALLDDYPSGAPLASGQTPANFTAYAQQGVAPLQQPQHQQASAMMDTHSEEFNTVLAQSVQNGKLNDQLLLMPAAQGMMDLSFDGLLEMFQADPGLLDVDLPADWMAVQPTPLPPAPMPAPSPTASGSSVMQGATNNTMHSYNASSEHDCQSSAAYNMRLTSEISSAQRSYMQQVQQQAHVQAQGQRRQDAGAAQHMTAPAAYPAGTSQPTTAPPIAHTSRQSSTGGIASQMSAIFRKMQSAKQARAVRAHTHSEVKDQCMESNCLLGPK